jgi:GNAT superfamily N-acetyltransferase
MQPANKHPAHGHDKTPLSRKILARLKELWHSDIEEIVLQHELRPEAYRTRTRLELVEADRALVRQFCREHDCPRALRVKLSSYLDNHYHGLFAVLDGEVIGYVWWFDDRIDPADAHPYLSRFGLVLEPGDVWSFHLYIAPEHRGGGVSNDFFVLLRKYLAGRGYKRVFGHVRADNVPAVWLHKLQRYTPVKTVRSRIFLDDAILVSDGRVYLRNPTVGVKQKFDYHLLGTWSRPSVGGT